MTTALPDLFIERLRRIVPPEKWDAVWQALHAPKRAVGFRLNPLRLSEDGVSPIFDWFAENRIDTTPLSGLFQGFSAPFEHRTALSHSPWSENGQLWLQNPGSQWIGQLVDALPGMEVLDLAAAPGSKTTQLAALMENTGYLAAVEPIRGRYFRLKENLKRMGVENVRTFMADGRSIGRKVPGRFDRVLLDAPCSSEGRMHALEPESLAHWSPRKIREQSRKQKGLILSAWQALKPGGVLTYATCSFAPEENERIIAHLLKKAPEAELLPIELPFDNWQPGLTEWDGRALPEALRHARRILPDGLFDGFFVARVRKPG
ncbi:RsmB/NOP family class I SAM-dependent RNA methyltransferase [Sulfurivirga sp.]|uniref:RsmB/NOP family class I SAM-dependent RNA methyltransferase n=1 Tax=Sulfurivirga sp. TaxID=2614236 RepID=UPI0025D0ACED|nr:RsmB/NOP family class I SAM-dependent RNA methyltransferase [Sulfurivirga sp.]